jgi:phenylpropionate dioxygenase-like ring-hydroxylating dioxygenase large terminal subunit
MVDRFPLNAWYAAAWASEVGDDLFARRLLGVPVLIYRLPDGTAVAFEDMCPHRFAPLSMGRKTATGVECRYHGLHFDGTGMCDRNPSGKGHFPPGTRLKGFPLVERHRMLWIWMGDAEAADPDLIPDYSLIPAADEGLANIGNYLRVHANWMLEIDNLMDLSHVNYLHLATLGNESRRVAEVKVAEVGSTIRAELSMPGTTGGFGPMTGKLCDQWLNMIWMAPSSMILEFGATEPGGEPRQDPRNRALHTDYFFGSGGAYAEDERESLDFFRRSQLRVFENEDNPMIEAVAERMQGADFWSMRPAILPNDKAAVRVRRRIERMCR